jgi:hypothetical protein
MSLDAKFRRAFDLMQPEISRMLERQRSKIAGYDDVRWDESSNEAAYFRGGAAIWRPFAEPLARFTPELGLFRWAWAGRAMGSGGTARIDLAFREAREMGVAEVQSDQVYCDTEKEAEQLAALGAQLARADGILKVNDGMRLAFVALWDPATHYPNPSGGAGGGGGGDPQRRPRPSQMPPPGRDDALDLTPFDRPISTGPAFRAAVVGSARASQAPPGSLAGRRSAIPQPPRMPTPMAPIPVATDDPWDVPAPFIPSAPPPPRETRSAAPPPPVAHATPGPLASGPASVAAASPALPVREPSPSVFRPVAQLVLGALSLAMPNGFREALFLMSLDVQDGKGRFYVHVVGASPTGELVTIDPSRELLEATAKMVGDDAREGNGRWRRLTAKLASTEQGVAVDLEVKR